MDEEGVGVSAEWESSNEDLVWYASYGSNMCFERFMCYIKGGQVEGMKGPCRGAKNGTAPRMVKHFTIPHHLYFSKESITWGGGGVAFLHPSRDESACTHSRIYLISKHQFVDVVKQENREEDEASLHVDFDLLRKHKKLDLIDAWYGTVLYLGDHEGYPVFSFTNSGSLHTAHINPPSDSYISIISSGLKQMGFSDAEIVEYFSKQHGVHKRIEHTKLLAKVSASPKIARTLV